MKLITVRHGQTQANAAGIAAGREIDSPLTDQGTKDAQAAAEHLRGTKIDAIFATPMRRTAHTAEIIRQILGLDLPIQIAEDFNEIKVGEGAGWSIERYIERRDSGEPIVGAESAQQIFKRVSIGLNKFAQRSDAVLLVTHGDICRMIECLNQGLDITTYTDLPQRANGEVKDYLLPLEVHT